MVIIPFTGAKWREATVPSNSEVSRPESLLVTKTVKGAIHVCPRECIRAWMTGLTQVVPHILNRARNLVLPQLEKTKMLILKGVLFPSSVRARRNAVWPETCWMHSRYNDGYNAPITLQIDPGMTELQHFL